MPTLPQSDYYVAPVPEKPIGGVLVLHAWWGLTPFFKTLSDHLAALGFMVIAPDLYHGKVANSIIEAQKLRAMLRTENVEKEIKGALRELTTHLDSTARFGVVGFSMGAHRALWLADQPDSNISATVLFYGTRGGDYLSTRSAFLGHFAEEDHYVARSSIEQLEARLRQAGREVWFHTYPETDHWFFEHDRPEAYHHEAAALAWERTVEFLLRELKPRQEHADPSLLTQSPRKPSRGS